MLPLDDPRWKTYLGGYGVPYSPVPVLRRLLAGEASDELWEELWTELHHQGDVNQASYATVPWFVESLRRSAKLSWNALALVATIELERPRPRNPKVGPELAEAYAGAIRALPAVLGTHPDQEWSEDVVQAAVACIALARGQRWHAQAYFELNRDSAARWFTEEFGWELGDA